MPEAFVSRHPVVLQKLTQLRSQDTEASDFRELLHQLSHLIGVEALADLPTTPVPVHTPLQECSGFRLAESVALIPILRAGLGMVDGLTSMIPEAKVRHVGYYRNEQTLQPVAYYSKLAESTPEDLALLLDPMLATGGSAIAAISAVKQWGPKRIKFLGILGSPEGVAALHEAHPDVQIFLCGLDEKLDERGYILPGLGDAGDRLYNT